uniref:S1 motif domain-containing protein n=1 Tax=Anopheles atroparvus TaxID=41427 RepID=A0AAG5CNF0_ANOAO
MVFLTTAFPRGENDKRVRQRKLDKRSKYGSSTLEVTKPRHLRPKDRRRALLDEKEQEEEEQELALQAHNLTSDTLQEGMLVMGCVRQIFRTELAIALPGRQFGTVPISAISDAYSNRLQAMMQTNECDCPVLEDLYDVGDLVYVKVISKKPSLVLSLKPADLHSEFVASQLVPGLVLAAAIAADEDHGFLMETGIPHVRAFLPRINFREGDAEIGRNLFCAVEKVSQLDGKGATLILKAFKKSERRQLRVDVINLDTVVPGCVMPFTVGSPVEDGLRGTLFDDTVPAFVNRCMLTTPTSKPEDYSLFKQMDATLLYVFPVTKQVFVSLVPYKNNKVEAVKSGKDMLRRCLPQGYLIENALVVDVTSYGVWFHFDQRRAILPRSIIMKGMKADCNYEDTIRLGKYHLGSVHKLFVLRYDPLDRSYIVCDKMDNARDEILLPDVQVGRTYRCEIVKSTDDDADGSMSVQLGKTSGLVPKHYLDRKTTPKLGSIVPMVAVAKDETCVTFTNRSEFMRSNAKILSDWNQIDVNARNPQTFDGVVVEELFDECVVEFFNNIRGRISKHAQPEVNDAARLSMLHYGAIARFTVAKVFLNRYLLLCLPKPVGHGWIEVKQAAVTEVLPTEVVVEIEKSKSSKIPLENFSAFPEHNAVYAMLLRRGQTVPVVEVKPGICTVRDVRYLQYKPSSVAQVQVGDILRAFCYKSNDKVYANLLLTDYNTPVEVCRMGPASQQENIPEGKMIMMKVTNIREGKGSMRNLETSCTLRAVCPKGIESVFSYMMDYLEDVINLIGRFKQNGKSFANYNIGQPVVCTFVRFMKRSNKMVVSLHDKANPKIVTKGIALKPKKTTKESYQPGVKLNGRVVWVDVERRVVHVCIDPKLLQCIGDDDFRLPIEPRSATEVSYCCVLFRNNYVRVCCIKMGSKHPLVLVPARYHYNDLQTYNIDQKQYVSVIVCKKFGPLLFGMHVKSFNLYNSYDVGTATTGVVEVNKRETSTRSQEPVPVIRGFTEGVQEPSTTRHAIDDDVDASEGSLSEDDSSNSDDDGDADDDGDEQYWDSMDDEEDEDYVCEDESKADKPSKTKIKKAGLGNGVHLFPSLGKAKIIPQQQTPLVEKKKKVNENKKKKSTVKLELTEKPNTAKKSNTLAKNGKRKLDDVSLADSGKPLKKKQKKKNKKKQAPFVIDQLDGCDNDFLFDQLDGADTKPPPKTGQAPKRTHNGKEKESKGLPGATNFWDSTPVHQRPQQFESSEEDSEEEDEQKQADTKKRLTAKERFESMKLEEERLRKIEEELANPSTDPHTPDQFDRLVLAQPNNSMLWIRYMVFHMESVELDKARAVARRALKSINFREEADLLNVWVALLNLEIRYETVDSFKEVLQEAIQYNDPFKVYSRVLDILIDCQKHTEVRELLELLQKKFRKQNDMWYVVADSWYRIGQGGKAKPLLSQALKSLPNRDHIPLIVKFAFLHNRNGNRDEAHLLFEQILTSYPKRTDIWSQYVDMLVKDGLVENARQILERAVVQRLPMKNMKTLYTKFVHFEEKHGNRDSVRRVKQLATDYVQAQLNNAGIANSRDK